MDVALCEALRLLPPTPTLTGVAYDDFEVPVDGRTGLEKGQHLCIPPHTCLHLLHRRSYAIRKDTTLSFQERTELCSHMRPLAGLCRAKIFRLGMPYALQARPLARHAWSQLPSSG